MHAARAAETLLSTAVKMTSTYPQGPWQHTPQGPKEGQGLHSLVALLLVQGTGMAREAGVVMERGRAKGRARVAAAAQR